MIKPIEAAGGLIARASPDGPRVLVIHRPRYDDWTFPKGKNEAGEESMEAAIREVAEETGQQPRLVSMVGETSYPVDGTKKVVQWYGMRAHQPTPFTPNEEVDEIRWLTTEEAPALLSYDHDRKLLERVDLEALLTTGTLYLVRHGAAGDRHTWTGDDPARPLSRKGELQAAGSGKNAQGAPARGDFHQPLCSMRPDRKAPRRGNRSRDHRTSRPGRRRGRQGHPRPGAGTGRHQRRPLLTRRCHPGADQLDG